MVATLLALALLSVGCENNGSQSAVATNDSHAANTDNESTTDTDDSVWQLVWSDEFDSDELDLEKWKYETGDNGWGNEEWQNYTAVDNSNVGDGTLKIIAKKVGEGQKVGDYTSARLNSKFSFTHGRVEVRAKIPELKGNGLWHLMKHMTSNVQSKPLIALKRKVKGPRGQPPNSVTTDPKQIDAIIRAAYGKICNGNVTDQDKTKARVR